MTSLLAVASCLSDYDPDALPVVSAQRIIRDFASAAAQRLGSENVAVRAALGRVLAADILSPLDVPAHDNSAMDGYAFAGAALAGARDALTLKIATTVLAGQADPAAISSGCCARIMTGAVMPPGCDTVIPQELTQIDGTTVRFAADAVRHGDNRRLRGEDLSAGNPALRAGRVLCPADLGLLASLGIAEVPVKRRLRVAFFSTGDELRSIGQTLEPGCVFDSNRYTLYGMLTRLGIDLIDMGVIRDEPAALEAAFRSAASNADAVITSGGVSVGEADFTKQLMQQLGDVAFWKIAMRPGRPMAFGRIGATAGNPGALLFGLPGNPVAVMVTFYALVRDALLAMSGAAAKPLPLFTVRCAQAIRKKPGRTEYQRGILSQTDDGTLQVAITGSQGSGVLRSMSEANCLIVLAHDSGNIAAGQTVQVLPFEGL